MPPSATSLSPSEGRNAALDAALLWLCRIDSPIGEERALCDAVVERLSRLPLAGAIRRYENSIVVPLTRSPGEGGARRAHVALVGHLDTVRTENGPARVEGDRLFAAGASDMKSGLALMLVLAESMEPFPCDLTLVFYSREEGPFAENELGIVLEKDDELRHVDLAVCLEPSDNHVQLGCSGSIHASLTFEGKTAHSARPWQGENAVTKAAAFLAEMHARAPVVHTVDGYEYRDVMTITQARDGGRGRNVVPDRFHLNLNRRFPPTLSSDAAKASIVELVAGRAQVEFIDVSPAAPPSATHPLVKALLGAGVAGVGSKQAWTDVGRFAALGIPAVNWGPGENAQAHQKNESTPLPLLHAGDVILRRFLHAASGR